MSPPPANVKIYHITDLTNLPGILASNGLHSDAVMTARGTTVIGHGHIKERRLREIRVPCCGNRFVGEFVPFYFCPRSPMLYSINRGNTGRDPGCQKTIVHLVSTVGIALATGSAWAISTGNAGAYHTTFHSNLNILDDLDWGAIEALQWQGRTHQKSAEFLVADFFPWAGVTDIGCHDSHSARIVQGLVGTSGRPAVAIRPDWYYPSP